REEGDRVRQPDPQLRAASVSDGEGPSHEGTGRRRGARPRWRPRWFHQELPDEARERHPRPGDGRRGGRGVANAECGERNAEDESTECGIRRRASAFRVPRSAMTSGGAFFGAVGILLSRLTGLVRQRVFSHYFGLRTDPADAFTAAFRIPNFLQNLFGEGALSASFIPVYASLLARGERREADRVAGAVASLLALIVAAVVLLGVVATPVFIDAVAPGFHGAKRELT